MTPTLTENGPLIEFLENMAQHMDSLQSGHGSGETYKPVYPQTVALDLRRAAAELRLLNAARAELAEVREAAGPFVELDKALPNWTGGTAINVTVYHVGAPTVIKGLLRVRDLRRLAEALKEKP